MMMWKKVLILLFAAVALVHVSWASPTELPSSIHDEEVMETTTILPSSGDSDVVVETTADETVEDGSSATAEMESGTESDEAREFDPNDCFLEKSRGPCRAVIDSWFFNVATKTCEPFMWSGCGGNNNRFKDKILCEKHCISSSNVAPSANDTAAAAAADDDDIMILNASASSTEDASLVTTTPSVTTATESSSTTSTTTTTTAATTTTTLAPPKKKIGCPKFEGCAAKCIVVQEQSSGGCKKCQCPLVADSETSSVKITRSVSKTEGLLVAAAKSPSIGSVSGLPVHAAEEGEESSEDTTERPEEICNLPATRGHCRAMMTRYRYDPKVKDCVQFHFGGCEGNANNFVTKEKCMVFCEGQ